MKRLFCIFLLFALSGCATVMLPSKPYTMPGFVKNRLDRSIAALNECKAFKQGKRTWVHVVESKDVNGWCKDGNIYLTSALTDLGEDAMTYVIAHEAAHQTLNHRVERMGMSAGVTAVMLVADAFVPGVGLLNYAVNPAVTNNVISKPQELEADLTAYKACLCAGMSKERVIYTMKEIRDSDNEEGGGFWAAHPPWSERIQQIQDSPE